MAGQPSWPPFRPSKDCSQPFCSIYCPQWCYFLFPPPPTFDPSYDVVPSSDSDSGPTLSPAVIVIVTLIAATFLLSGYYALVYKYRQSRHRPTTAPAPAASSHASPPSGLDESLINKITMFKYKKQVGLVGGTNCSVCLSEFREDESLRLLPKCSHTFHVQCIDTWLKSHPNCPLCRAGIVWTSPPLRFPTHPESSGGQNMELAIVLQDSETSFGTNRDVSKDPSEEAIGGDVIEVVDNGIQSIKRSFSMGSSCRGRNSIGDLVVNGNGVRIESDNRYRVSGSTSSPRQSMSSAPLARSLSCGRSCFPDHGKGSSGVLPL